MSKADIEKMKQMIEDKKKKGMQKDLISNTSNNVNVSSSKGFKSMKKGGSLNK